MKIVELILDENQDASGIEAISIVENPAIEEDFVALKSDEIGKLASLISGYKDLRKILLTYQRKFAQTQHSNKLGVILDGRDRPITIPNKTEERLKNLEEWSNALDEYPNNLLYLTGYKFGEIICEYIQIRSQLEILFSLLEDKKCDHILIFYNI